MAVRGRGTKGVAAGGTDYTLTFSSPVSGSAPSVGDLVIYGILALNSSGGNPFQTPTGWTTQSSNPATSVYMAIFSKVITQDDLDNPAIAHSGANTGSLGSWIAFSPTNAGFGGTVTIGSYDAEYGGASAPSNIGGFNLSSIIGPAFIVTFATGDDDSTTTTWTGVTADSNQSANGVQGTVDMRMQWKEYTSGTGGNLTSVSKSDDGAFNGLWGCYVTVGELFATDFGSYSTGAQPSDWTETLTPGTWTVETTADALDGRALRHNRSSGSGFSFLSWDDVPSQSIEGVEILHHFKINELPPQSGTSLVPMFVGTVAGYQATGYFVQQVHIDHDTAIWAYDANDQWPHGFIVIDRFTNSPPFPQERSTIDPYTVVYPERWYFMRTRYEGGHALSRFWRSGAPEPSTWTIDWVPALLTTGTFGLAMNANNSGSTYYYCDYYAVGNRGLSIPLPSVTAIKVPPKVHQYQLDKAA